MFVIEDKLKFVNVDIDYLRAMHDACSEAFFMEVDYERKPYLGLFVTDGVKKYVIPLTSAKNKHKSWNNLYPDRFLIYEIKPKTEIASMSYKDVYYSISNTKIKHILSAAEIKKMIPVRDDVITYVDFVKYPTDTKEEIKFKDLLDREYAFCVSISDKILDRVNKIYDKQMKTGKVLKFGCDFKALEKASESYIKK